MILTVESTLTDVFLPLFTIDWEQRKLGEMASFAKGNGYTKADLSTEGKPIILYGRLYTDYETVFSSIDTRSGQKPGSLLSKGGEVVVPASGETADEIARASVVMPDGIILGGDLNVITPNQAINPVFLAIELSSGNLHKVLASKAQGKSVVHLHNSDLQTLDVVFPSLDEQSQIGLCFEEFDALITLHQRKLDDLKKLKSGLLQKMFPKAGETVPEVRFPEFTGDWEQRKFKDLVFKSGKKNKKNLPYESFSITNESGFVSQNERFENGGTMKDADKSMYIIVSPNSFAYNPARINVGSIGYQALGKNVIVSSLYEVFKTSHEVDDHFLWYWFKSDHFKRLVESLQEGGVRLYFYFDKLQKGELWLPPIEEQRKIGGYFKSVDNLITLHQRKLFIIAYIK
ncbi:restriction endonuclease subunit S [Faecalibaculum rodentium]|uniref:restriction endonuclease subunit S n=3 Tax=Faecalibaculum rodentium TaxID=1702221 RepID=UPI0025A67EFA|nr:restriction endonuclease subunit S [Faecalibaculum rodentium]